jgi:hypothetical protein
LPAIDLARALGIGLADEGIEALLLLQAVATKRPHCLLPQGQMHALVAAILLQMARLDAFDGDAEAKSSDREV